ncbi:hypothetical protein [Tumebacillus permanentifrigoris]|uniref:Uncharacterized protein n=1 Tax=Tumebacillus permanentifrigoris TaxID=378543 RepID=A0A316D9L1_9BACL|nr:hypothetical protein [Tumebacillus permanentifrigoris]PWK12784.1 hypothetical protein C7459_109146 [Tumebacillus permanentifrigoris]
MTMSETLKLMAIAQSARQIEYSLGELEGVTNAVVSPEFNPQVLSQRLQDIRNRMQKELRNIEYVVSQGNVPKSQQELEIGIKVQEAINEISQI